MATSSPPRDSERDRTGLPLANTRAALVTPSDDTATGLIGFLPRFLRIGHDGSAGPARSNVVVVYGDGSTETLSVVPGQRIDCRPVRVHATGTTSGVVIYACD